MRDGANACGNTEERGERERITLMICGLRAQNGGSEIAVTVHLVSGEQSEVRTLVVDTETVGELDLHKGAIGEEIFDLLEERATLHCAVLAGERLLAYGSNTCAALVEKLRRRGFEREAAQNAAEILANRGLIDEERDMRRETERCLAKLWGEERIRAQLYARGFRKETIAKLPEVLQSLDVDFAHNCKLLIEKRYGLPQDRDEERRTVSALCRYGYRMAEIRAAVRSLRAERSAESVR